VSEWIEPDGTPIEVGEHSHAAIWDHVGGKWDAIDLAAIRAEAAEGERHRLARLGAEKTTPEKQAASLRKYNADIVAVIEAEALANR
jgi:hypothetical protein